MDDSKMTRRTYLQTIAVGFAAAGLGGLSACKSGAAELVCTDTAGLSEMDATLRKSLAYADKSVLADKNCENCVQFIPAGAANSCGTCKLVKGPVNPKGYCSGWAAKG